MFFVCVICGHFTEELEDGTINDLDPIRDRKRIDWDHLCAKHREPKKLYLCDCAAQEERRAIESKTLSPSGKR